VKYILILAVAVLAGCSDAVPANPMLTYEQLKSFPMDCEKKDAQLKQLNYIKTAKNFPQNPEDISNEMDRAYNSRLKSTIWWYTYRCEQ
jgi:hypothetical protein